MDISAGRTVTATSDRRAEPRVKAGLTVLVTRLNAHPMEACLLDLSPRGARLRVPEVIPVGSEVKIQANELLLFGTIKRCGPMHGALEVGIALSFPLEVLHELRILHTALLAASEPF